MAASEDKVTHMERSAAAYRTSAGRLMRQMEGVLSTEDARMGSMPLTTNYTCLEGRLGWGRRGEGGLGVRRSGEDLVSYSLVRDLCAACHA